MSIKIDKSDFEKLVAAYLVKKPRQTERTAKKMVTAEILYQFEKWNLDHKVSTNCRVKIR
jgi:hypothetical protein